MVLLRRIEVDSPVHRLWAGTKLLAVVAVSITVSEAPSWPVAALLAVGLLGVARLARIPWSAVPRLPGWVWFGLAVLGGFSLAAGGRPYLHLGGGTRLGLGALELYVLVLVVGLELLTAGLIVGWTTALGDVGPAMATLGRPLRVLRLPVEEWAVAVALCVRSLPLLVGEIRVLFAARRLRPRRAGRSLTERAEDGLELLATAITVAVRRAAEMGEAITARGGVSEVTARVDGPRLRDGIALALVVAVCGGAWLLPT